MAICSQTEAFTDDDILAVLTDTPPAFDYEQFIETLGIDTLPSPRTNPADIPPQQWQMALNYLTLTPAEQLARERYFEQKAQEALRPFQK